MTKQKVATAAVEGKVVAKVAIPASSEDKGEPPKKPDDTAHDEMVQSTTDDSRVVPKPCPLAVATPPKDPFQSILPSVVAAPLILIGDSPSLLSQADSLLHSSFDSLAQHGDDSIFSSLWNEESGDFFHHAKAAIQSLDSALKKISSTAAVTAPQHRVRDAEIRTPGATLSIYNNGTIVNMEQHDHRDTGAYACQKFELSDSRGIQKDFLKANIPKDMWSQAEKALDECQLKRQALLSEGKFQDENPAEGAVNVQPAIVEMASPS